MKPNKLKNHAERGASLVEYVILVALISMICIVAIRTLRNQIILVTNNSTDELAGAGGGETPG